VPHHPDLIAGRYRVLGEAGRGGMGSVYHCVDDRLHREVAVKQVGRMPGESVTDQARALREARSSAALHHPHVVSIYDAVAEGDHIWLVMEHVRGRTLSQILREDGPLPPARAAWIGAQVAEGLAAAHERGTVHRDVKPGNILVSDGDHAKISDFGIARTHGDSTLTRSGVLIGTPAYFAPEIARGGAPSPAADVWALGVALYSAVEGRLPHDDDPNPLGLLGTIAVEEPRRPERAGPLTDALGRMLDRDPASRWSMADVAHALRQVADHGATPDDTREATPVLGATGGEPEPEQELEPGLPAVAPAPGAAPRRRKGRGALVVAGLVLLLAAGVGALLLLDRGQQDAPEAGRPAPDPTASPTSSPSEPSDEETPEEAEPTPTQTDEDSSEPSVAAAPAAFVEDYYAVLPDDTRSGYERLSPSYQEETSFGEYDGFWSTVDSVTVEDSASTGPRAVDVTLVYDGAEREVRRIYLERGEGGWLIADDEVVG
jgi:serine/threonine protein kinase